MAFLQGTNDILCIMYRIFYTNNFKKQLAKVLSSGRYTESEVNDVINTLAMGKMLDVRFKNHKLSGEYTGFYECHIRPDLLLIYEKDNINMILTAISIGSHSELFG